MRKKSLAIGLSTIVALVDKFDPALGELHKLALDFPVDLEDPTMLSKCWRITRWHIHLLYFIPNNWIVI